MKLKYVNLYGKFINEYAAFSTCARLSVAAMLVKDGRILSVGYNGVAKGHIHCCEMFKKTKDGIYAKYDELGELVKVYKNQEEWSAEHHAFSVDNEFHAEMNCIAFASKNKINIADCDMVLNISPCINCAKMIYLFGIKNVYYIEKYDRDTSGIEFLKNHGVNIGEL